MLFGLELTTLLVISYTATMRCHI